jgi:ABC-2 type transport system permease protein
MTGVTFTRVLRFEWIKFWSLRSSWITLALAVAVFIGTGLLASSLGFDADSEEVAVFDVIGISLAGSILAMLVVGALGVLVMTGEYGSGTIRSTLAAVPRRLPVLAAKVLVFGAVTYAVMFAAAVAAFLAGQAIIGSAGASLADDGALRAIFGNAAYVTGAGLLGLLLGGVLRSTAGALSTYFGVMFLLTVVSQLILSQSWRENVGKFLPSAAGEAMGAVVQPADALTPGQGALVFTGYLVLAGVLASWRLKRSDAT